MKSLWRPPRLGPVITVTNTFCSLENIFHLFGHPDRRRPLQISLMKRLQKCWAIHFLQFFEEEVLFQPESNFGILSILGVGYQRL